MKYTINGYNYEAKTSTFPGGEEFICLDKAQHPTEAGIVEVHADVRSSTNVMQLLLLTDCLREHTKYATDVRFDLHLGYLPYARQDRRCAKGESFSLKVFANLINGLKFDHVFLDDCHSDVGIALLDNVTHNSQGIGIRNNAAAHNLAKACDVIVAPDAGAAKKAQEIADYYDKPLVQCLKTRVGSQITIQVLGDITGKKALVVDDICDGGGTFLALAKSLNDKGAFELNLYVTHGIFSKGKEIILEQYDTVETLHDWTT